MGKRLNENDFNAIIARKLMYKQSNEVVAAEIGTSEKSVRTVVRVFNLVRDKNFKELIKAAEYENVTLQMVEWASRELKIAVPIEEIKKARDLNIEKRTKNQKEKKEEPAAPVSKPKENTNDGLYMLKILEALNKQNELLEQLMDVVVPKYAGDMKDNLNANTDVICERLKNCQQSLEKIACNSRKRGL
jgi:hypothetical protein